MGNISRFLMDDVDLETVSQAYCNIIVGSCMAIALKYAGSANSSAFETLVDFAIDLHYTLVMLAV